MKIIASLALVLVLGGCVSKTVETACQKEERLHALYLRWVAPFRTAAQVDNAKKWHQNAMAVCAVAGAASQVEYFTKKAQEARK